MVFDERPALNSPKIVSLESLADKLEDTGRDKTVVTTNGCFDILHPGHIFFLEQAKKLGDILIVALNSDKSVKYIKGHDRPIIDQAFRAYSLSALSFTDYVTVFDEQTPERLLTAIKPDIHVKGVDYKVTDIPERTVVESFGGKVIYLPLVEGFSTSQLIRTIKESIAY